MLSSGINPFIHSLIRAHGSSWFCSSLKKLTAIKVILTLCLPVFIACVYSNGKSTKLKEFSLPSRRHHLLKHQPCKQVIPSPGASESTNLK